MSSSPSSRGRARGARHVNNLANAGSGGLWNLPLPLLLTEGPESSHHQPALCALPGLGRALLGLGAVGYRRGRHDYIVINPAVAVDEDRTRLVRMVLL